MPPLPPRISKDEMPAPRDLRKQRHDEQNASELPTVPTQQKKKKKGHDDHSFISRRIHAPKGHGDALETNFAKLLDEAAHESDGYTINRYRMARKKLRRAQASHEEKLAVKDEEHASERAHDRFFDEQVRLSAVTGGPTLANPISRKMELERLALEKAARGEEMDAPPSMIEQAVFNSLTAGEMLATEKRLDLLPEELANTLTMQMGLQKIFMPRNELTDLLNLSRAPALSCRNLMHVVDLDLQHNQLKRLPHDFGQLVSLKRLVLQHNCLEALPDSFLWLTQLKHLDLSHNLFKYMTDHIGNLKSLEKLIIVKNMLMELPSTLPNLENMTFLDISGNGLAHLAIKPLTTSEDSTVTEAWEEVIDPSTKKKYYYNKVTKQSRASMPDSLKVAKASGGKLVPGTAAYNNKRKSLAAHGTPEWEAVVDAKQGTIFYQNNVSGDTSWTMPEVMDVLGKAAALVTFKCNDNTLRGLPESLSMLENLKTLEAKDNFLGKLPDDIGSMQGLRFVKVSNNELRDLPISMAKLTNLVELHLTSNQFTTLPAWIGDLKDVRRLMFGNNNLTTLPFKIGYLKNLEELQVFNNPLEYPPYELINEGMDQLQWALRRKYLEAVHGPSPVMNAHFYGIADEKIDLEPEFNDRIQQAVDKAAMTNELVLQQQGLFELPPAINELTELEILKLSANHLNSAPPHFEETLQSLQVLWLKNCEVQELDNSIGVLHHLKHLDLEDNHISALPEHFVRLRKLETLNLSKNKLFDLPDDLGKLTALKELYVDINRLDLLPESVSSLRHLEILSACMNSIYELPECITELVHLTSLNLDANEIHRLPIGMGNLHLKLLKVAHNRLERLDEGFLAPNLRTTIECLWVSNNNMQELPALFNGVEKLTDIHIDYNPMRSPPVELLSEGMNVIIQYCRIRAERVHEVKDLLDEYGFDSEPINFSPECRGALTGETGFLTPEDLVDFDAALDTFVNGAYYKCPVSAADLVDKVDALKHEREYVFYNMMLQELLRILEKETGISGKKKRFSGNVVRQNLKKEWGKDQDEVNCYAVTLDALLRETPKNQYVKKFRPSLFQLMVEELPVTVFEYTPELLKDAINKFEGPYGHVAMIDKVKFDKDEYVDPETGKERRKFPCVVPALVIAKVIYTATEARRRAEEDDMYWNAFQQTEDDIEDWCESKVGRKRLQQEMKKRQKLVAKDVQTGEATKREKETAVHGAEDTLELINQRKKDFDAGKPAHLHKISSVTEAIDLIASGEDKLSEAKRELRIADKALKESHAKLRMKKKDQVTCCTDDLKRKFCHKEWARILEEQRSLSDRRGWRRPWDGEDGEEFATWLAVKATKARSHDEEEELEEVDDTPDWLKGDDGENDDEYSWENTANLEQYESEAYTRYLTAERPEGLAPPWKQHLGGDAAEGRGNGKGDSEEEEEEEEED